MRQSNTFHFPILIFVPVTTYSAQPKLHLFTRYEVFRTARRVTANIAYFVPRNTNVDQLASLGGRGEMLEVEQNILTRKFKTLTAYYGELVYYTGAEADY